MSWDHLPDFIKPDLWLDEDHAIEFFTAQGETEPTGAHFIHRDKRDPSRWCIGGFQWRGKTGPNWQLVSMDPLHVEPSIRCGCGEHGHIRNGEWQPA